MSLSVERHDHERIEKQLKALGWHALPNFKPRQTIETYLRWDLIEEAILNFHATLFRSIDTYQQEEIKRHLKNTLEQADVIQALSLLKYGVAVSVKIKGVLQRHRLWLIDWDHWENNVFHYAYEAGFPGAPQGSKPDFTLFVNGIPLVIIEVKQTRGIEANTHEQALSQIERYERRSPQLFHYVQLAIAYGTEQVYIPTWPITDPHKSKQRLPQYWRPYLPKSKNYGEKDIFALLTPQVLLRVIRYYTYTAGSIQEGTFFRLIPRYMQFYTVERAIQRSHAYLAQDANKNKGLIWHWQGSGKSYEIFPFLSVQFMERFREKHPHVFIVVDRKELEEQMWSKYMQTIHLDPSLQITTKRIDSVASLKEVLKTIEAQSQKATLTHANIYLVLLHKFRAEELNNIAPINKREILILRDEVHRTEHGKLAEVLYSKFPQAIRFGFTGTPLIHEGDNTFEAYGYPQEGELYMDCFFIAQSIKDGYTLPLLWREVAEKAICLPEIEEIKQLVEDILQERYGEENLEVSNDELSITLRDLLLAEDRIKKACEYIAEHIEEDTEGFTYKAFVVVPSRYAAVLFHKYLKESLQRRFEDFKPAWVQVVMTGEGVLKNSHWQKTIEAFIAEEEQKYGKRWEELIEQRKKAFRDKDKLPKVLIVSDMLLQGYDAPVLKVLYLYKLMGSTRLLQAIARTNRPYKTLYNGKELRKKHGLIVDLTGILLRAFREAITHYHFFAAQAIEEDLLQHIFEDIHQKWKNFLEEFHNFKDLLNTALKMLSWDYEKLKQRWGKMTETEMSLIFSFLSQRQDPPTPLELINDLHRVIRTFESIGTFPEKVAYYEDYAFMQSLLQSLQVRYFGKEERKRYATLNLIKETALNRIHFKPFEDRGVIAIDERMLTALPSEVRYRIEIEHLIYALRRELDEKREKGPIYEVLYEELLKLREHFLMKREEVEEMVSFFKNKLSGIKTAIQEADKQTQQPMAYQIAKAAFRKHLSTLVDTSQKEQILQALARKIEEIKRVKRMDNVRKKKLRGILLRALPQTVEHAFEVADAVIESIEAYVNKYLLCMGDEQ